MTWKGPELILFRFLVQHLKYYTKLASWFSELSSHNLQSTIYNLQRVWKPPALAFSRNVLKVIQERSKEVLSKTLVSGRVVRGQKTNLYLLCYSLVYLLSEILRGTLFQRMWLDVLLGYKFSKSGGGFRFQRPVNEVFLSAHFWIIKECIKLAAFSRC